MGKGCQVVDAITLYIHPKYDAHCMSHTLEFDFGIMELKKDLFFGDSVQTIALARANTADGPCLQLVDGAGLNFRVPFLTICSCSSASS